MMAAVGATPRILVRDPARRAVARGDAGHVRAVRSDVALAAAAGVDYRGAALVAGRERLAADVSRRGPGRGEIPDVQEPCGPVGVLEVGMRPIDPGVERADDHAVAGRAGELPLLTVRTRLARMSCIARSLFG